MIWQRLRKCSLFTVLISYTFVDTLSTGANQPTGTDDVFLARSAWLSGSGGVEIGASSSEMAAGAPRPVLSRTIARTLPKQTDLGSLQLKAAHLCCVYPCCQWQTIFHYLGRERVAQDPATAPWSLLGSAAPTTCVTALNPSGLCLCR